jgi:hypothetical protein
MVFVFPTNSRLKGTSAGGQRLLFGVFDPRKGLR